MEKDAFGARGRVYSGSRPGYPDELFEYMERQGLLPPNGTAADVGAGTGIFSRLLARHISHVCAIEPSEDMRAQGPRPTKSTLPPFRPFSIDMPKTDGWYIHTSPACFTAGYDKQKERNTYDISHAGLPCDDQDARLPQGKQT